MHARIAVLAAALLVWVPAATADDWVAPAVPVAEDASIAPKLDALFEQKLKDLHIAGL
jgi:hypothetical protein